MKIFKGLKDTFSKIKNPVNVADIIGTIAGIVLIGIGLYQIYPPLMYITIGIIMAFPGIPRKGVN